MAMLVWGVVFGAFGMGYFVYGKQQRRIVALACGIGLMVFPYFVTGTLWMLLVGTALMAAPFWWRV